MGLSEVIKTNRELKGLTQEELASLLGVSRPAVGRWESGTASPRANTLIGLSRIFGISVSELLGEQAPPPQISQRDGMTALRTIAGTAPEEEVEFPPRILARHPRSFALSMADDGMSRLFPKGATLLVDPDAPLRNGDVVCASVDGGDRLVRAYLRGASTILLSPCSYDASHEDVIVYASKDVSILGVVVWFQAQKDSVRP